MTNHTPASPLALTAIAAVFALSSTAALAQETAAPDPSPVAVAAPAAAPVDSPAPIVIQETRSAPVEQAAPTATTPVAKPARANVASCRAAPHSVSHTAATTTAAPTEASVQTPRTATTIAPTVSAEPSPVAVEVPQVTRVASDPNTVASAQNDNTALELGLLGLVALGGAGAYGLARRRRRVVAPDTVYGDELLAAATPVVEPPVTSAPPITASPWVPANAAATAAESRAERVPTATSMAGTAIPAGPLPTGAALGALFERMANAAPDAENPFTATKRRRQRVRWLLKQHEYRLQNAGSQPFDYRNYATASQPQRELVEA